MRHPSPPNIALLAICVILAGPAPAMAEAAGRISDPGLRVEKAGADGVTLTWTGSCVAGDGDYEVYETDLSTPADLTSVTCSTGGETTYTYEPASGSRIFLVVPRNGIREGSYGRDGAGSERDPAVSACLPQEFGGCPASVPLADVDSGQPDPSGNYRWMDAADQLYSTSYRESYDYTQARVELQFFPLDPAFHGYLVARSLKPHFAYQVKLAGIPGTSSNEAIGLTGRWWQEEWDGSKWTNGQNLNNKGDGSSPNPNDEVYFSRRDVPDPTSPTGRRYRYTGYLPFDYVVTDGEGAALLAFRQDSSYHVLWKASQRTPTAQDGPQVSTTFDVTLPDPVAAYDTDYPEVSVTVFGEWERLPPGGVLLPTGAYDADLVLTEESFHGSGLAGSWAAAMAAAISFEITDP